MGIGPAPRANGLDAIRQSSLEFPPTPTSTSRAHSVDTLGLTSLYRGACMQVQYNPHRELTPQSTGLRTFSSTSAHMCTFTLIRPKPQTFTLPPPYGHTKNYEPHILKKHAQASSKHMHGMDPCSMDNMTNCETRMLLKTTVCD